MNPTAVIEGQSLSFPRWANLVRRIEKAETPLEALEAACEAKGYLYGLHDTGLISLCQRDGMSSELEESCVRQMNSVRHGSST